MIIGGRRIRRGTPLLIIELVPGQSARFDHRCRWRWPDLLPDRACRGDLNVRASRQWAYKSAARLTSTAPPYGGGLQELDIDHDALREAQTPDWGDSWGYR